MIDIPKRCHVHVRSIESTVRLRGYDGPLRQIAVADLGRERPTLLLSNNLEKTPRELIIRYAGRNRVEGGLGVSVNFFHLDCLASEVRLNVDLDAALLGDLGRVHVRDRLLGHRPRNPRRSASGTSATRRAPA